MKDRYSRFKVTVIGLALTALQSYAQSIYEPYTFVTVAGKAGTSGSVDGMNSAAKFNYPIEVTMDEVGNLYVADLNNNTLRRMSLVGTNWLVTTLAGLARHAGSADGTNDAARFNQPFGLAVDSAGNIYVGEAANNDIRKVTPVGTNWVVTTLVGAPTPGSADGTNTAVRFNQPNGITMDSAGNLYVTDWYNTAIRKVTPVGTNWVVTTIAGKPHSQGSADGIGSAARFTSPSGVAVDDSGNLYVTDAYAYTIRKVAPVGTNWMVTTIAGRAGVSGTRDGTNSTALFNEPSNLAVDRAGNVFVTEYEGTIRKMTPVGTNWVVTTVAGKWFNSGDRDGTGVAAWFDIPQGIVSDGAGNIYVTDAGSNTVRKGFQALLIASSGPDFGFTGGQFGFDLMGPLGKSTVIEATSDLVNWMPIWTNTLAAGLNFRDAQSGSHSIRFYRAEAR